MSPLRRQVIIIPLSLLLCFFVAYAGFKHGLRRTRFGSAVDFRGGYNALGRIRPMNTTTPISWEKNVGDKKAALVPDGMKAKDLIVAVENGTLGFGKILVTNLPQNMDRRDTMVLASAFSKLKIDWVDGIPNHETRATPSVSVQNQKSPARKSEAIGGAQMVALRTVVEQNLPSALIFEDDLDWDIRLKEQMHTFALSTRSLIQPLAVKNSQNFTYADPTYFNSSLSNKSAEIHYKDRPATLQPSNSAYGDGWDILLLGHCGMATPGRKTPSLPKGRVILERDPTIARSKTLTTDSGALQNQTRLYHHVSAPECAFAYAVSQRAARLLLYKVSLDNKTANLDDALVALCGGGTDQERGLVCLTTQPSLFSRWKGGGARSQHVRWSVRMNMGKYVRGDEMEWVDQYPD